MWTAFAFEGQAGNAIRNKGAGVSLFGEVGVRTSFSHIAEVFAHCLPGAKRWWVWWLQGAAAAAGRTLTLLRNASASLDHPANPAYLESIYLTNLLYRVT